MSWYSFTRPTRLTIVVSNSSSVVVDVGAVDDFGDVDVFDEVDETTTDDVVVGSSLLL